VSLRKREIDYLGIRVDTEGLKSTLARPKDSKIGLEHSKVSRKSTPTMGVLGYLRPFIQGFAHLAQPITDLLKKDKPFYWGMKQRQALDDLINIVISGPVLRQPDPTKPFMLEVDASDIASGAILYQYNEQNKLQPTRYYSKAFNEAERNMSAGDKNSLD